MYDLCIFNHLYYSFLKSVYSKSKQTNHKTTIHFNKYYANKLMLVIRTSTTDNFTTKCTTPCNCYKHDNTQYDPYDGNAKANLKPIK